MKKTLLLIFFLFVSCTTNNKVYICGDHPCKNKKEVDEYFKNNISMEVYVMKNKKEDDVDLVQLNLLKDKKINKKREMAFLNKRKQENINLNKEQKHTKLKLKVETEDKKKVKKINKKDNKTAKLDSKFKYKKQKSTKIVHLCKTINECDIDIISDKIIKLGKEGNFPDINFK
tara:strand:+ start:536 stop:1054 length:519 start_codon:yes stop_codon:yes gene_type:complete